MTHLENSPNRRYSFGVTIAASYPEAVERTRAALKAQGFGVLTEIDVQKTMKEKLDADFRPYVILGACNPSLAHQALSEDPGIGLLLPCNLIVYENGDGTTTIEAMDPEAALGIVGEDMVVRKVAMEAKARIKTVIETLGGER